MDTRHIELFVEVARTGSFAEAARRRDLDPSSVSRAIAGLESELGTRLYQRSTRRLSLTEAGERFLQRIEPLLAELTQAREEALTSGREPQGVLRMATSVAFGTHWLLPRLAAFLDAHPGIHVELEVSDRTVDLVAERIDLAIRLGPPVDTGLIGRRLMPTRYRVVAAPGKSHGDGPVADPQALSGRASLAIDLPGFRSSWTVRDRAGAMTTLAIQPRLIVSSAVTLRRAALEGLGYALLPDWLIDEDLMQGRLIDLLPDHEVTATSFDTAAWLLYPSRSFLPGKTRLMLEHLQRAARTRS